MSLKVKSLVIAVSAVSLVCGATATSQAQAHGHPDLESPARAASLHDREPVAATLVSSEARPRDDTPCTWIVGDGVRIRSTPGTSGAVLGLGYNGDGFREYQGTPDWVEGTDLRTGVRGWVSAQFVTAYIANCATDAGSAPTRPAHVAGQ